jgi:hypothetical protein
MLKLTRKEINNWVMQRILSKGICDESDLSVILTNALFRFQEAIESLNIKEDEDA